MTADDLTQLRHRILAGELPTDELRALGQLTFGHPIDTTVAEGMSDAWNLALHRELVPPLEAAKAIVETALASDSAYPISTNDGLIYDRLTPSECVELAQFILGRVGNMDAPKAKPVLLDFADDLTGRGPQV